MGGKDSKYRTLTEAIEELRERMRRRVSPAPPPPEDKSDDTRPLRISREPDTNQQEKT